MASNKKPKAELDLTKVPGIGPASIAKLKKLKINNLNDLINHYPRKYLDFSVTEKIANLKLKSYASIRAEVISIKQFRTRSGKSITEAIVKDDTAKISLIWFNNYYIQKSIKLFQTYQIAGKTSAWNDKISFISPTLELDDLSSTSGLIPIYPLTEGINSKWFRRKIKTTLTIFKPKDQLPPQFLNDLKLPELDKAYSSIHFPKDMIQQSLADQRISFDFHLRLNLKNQHEISKLPSSPQINVSAKMLRKELDKLPFKLTTEQQKALKQAIKDLEDSKFTHRLIQGETGSGKTVIAYLLSKLALQNNLSSVLLAPTQILAEQHFQSFQKLGLDKDSLSLSTSTTKINFTSDKPKIYIGTHSLIGSIPSDLKYPLAILTIDEQHKFGVNQRQELLNRNPIPHLFNLSATPIPRTIALGLFGEVSLSTIKHRPTSKQSIKTWVVDTKHFQRSEDWLKNILKQGGKIFVVCPVINFQENIDSTTTVYQHYLKVFGKETEVILVHGKMKPIQITKSLSKFKASKNGILVSTQIIEVGIDIPEAQVIIIHSAERFGLAQLHQLRGRVGRGDQPGYCLLITSDLEKDSQQRLKLLEKYHSGFTLSKFDLKLRGAGELFGLQQHGFLPVRLKNFWNRELYKKAKALAVEILKNYPSIAKTIADIT